MDDSDAQALTALRRFGLGPRPGDLARVRSDPRGALIEDMERPGQALIDDDSLMSSHEALRQYGEARRDVARVREQVLAQRAKLISAEAQTATGIVAEVRTSNGMTSSGMAAEGMAPSGMASPPDATLSPEDKADIVRFRQMPDLLYQAEVGARFAHQAQQPVGFTERLVMFWSNHFCIGLSQPVMRLRAGPFEREAIRPHVFGRFVDMLQAVERHPAMLVYLSNNTSVGPNSPLGRRKKRGLNENLAREILELHTLGVDGNYTQADVTSLARILTGRTVVPSQEPDGGSFLFSTESHEPGEHMMLGRNFPGEGVAESEAALDFLARQPATARHIARKLAAHFVADDPPPALVETLEKTFIDTDGDLAALAHALVAAPEAWDPEPKKLRAPVEYIVATRRLIGEPRNTESVRQLAQAMGQPIWSPVGPNGFSDHTDHWLSSKGMKMRLDTADAFARVADPGDPIELMGQAFGNAVSAETSQAVRRAESRQQAVAILLMSPEFQRR